MSQRSKLVLVALAACGGAERHETTTPAQDTPACPSNAAPGRCQDLAEAATNAGHGELAWAYTVLECESPTGAQCVAMWQRHARSAPTQTDALNVLHVACDHEPAACEQLAAWHTERGHVLTAAAYQKRVESARQSRHDAIAGPPEQPHAGNTLALAADLAAVMHLQDGPPRTDAIAQMVGHELQAPVVHDVATALQPQRKAWSMHAAEQGASSDGCASTAKLDRHPVAFAQCVREVPPLIDDQIALHNRCSQAITVAYTGARADHTAYTNQVRLEPYEARSAGISHRELGPLTYAVCAGDCRVTSSPDDATASWTGQIASYYCTRGGRP
jgi:hypothetical protein